MSIPPPAPRFVTEADLPLSCPPPEEVAWNMHPRIYLPIEEAKEVVCPYCSARYILTGEPPCV